MEHSSRLVLPCKSYIFSSLSSLTLLFLFQVNTEAASPKLFSLVLGFFLFQTLWPQFHLKLCLRFLCSPLLFPAPLQDLDHFCSCCSLHHQLHFLETSVWFKILWKERVLFFFLGFIMTNQINSSSGLQTRLIKIVFAIYWVFLSLSSPKCSKTGLVIIRISTIHYFKYLHLKRNALKCNCNIQERAEGTGKQFILIWVNVHCMLSLTSLLKLLWKFESVSPFVIFSLL